MIAGEIVSLRPARLDERPLIYDWLAHSDVTAEMLGEPRFPESPVPTWEEFCQDYRETHFDATASELMGCFIIEVQGERVGQLNFDRGHVPDGMAELDIWMRSRADCGHGWGSDALGAATRWLAEQRGVTTFLIRPSARNGRAVRAYERAGFRRVPMTDEEQARIYGEGDYADTVVMIKRSS